MRIKLGGSWSPPTQTIHNVGKRKRKIGKSKTNTFFSEHKSVRLQTTFWSAESFRFQRRPMVKLDKQSMAPCFFRKHSHAETANKEVFVSDLSLREKPWKQS